MIGRQQKANALAVLVAVWHRYHGNGFKVDLCGENYRPLRDAESMGWVWFAGPDRCALTKEGIAQISPWINRVDQPA